MIKTEVNPIAMIRYLFNPFSSFFFNSSKKDLISLTKDSLSTSFLLTSSKVLLTSSIILFNSLYN